MFLIQRLTIFGVVAYANNTVDVASLSKFSKVQTWN